MLSIRLARFGKKKQPSYRVVVCQKHKDPFGDYIESIGHINYFGNTKNITVDAERAKHWISVGAQPTDTVHNLFIEQGIIKDNKRRPDGTRKIIEKKEDDNAEEKNGTAEETTEQTDDSTSETKEDAPVEEKKEEKNGTAEEAKPEETKEQSLEK